jgi:hypothetical protein
MLLISTPPVSCSAFVAAPCRALVPSRLLHLSALHQLRQLALPAVQYDSCGITHIRRLPELAAAYDAAVAAVMSCLTSLTRLCYSLSGAPVDADLAPLAAASALVQLQLQVVWQQEQLLRLKMQQQEQDAAGGCRVYACCV